MELSPARKLTRTETTDVALAFLQEVERLTGREPAIYCSASTARDDYDSRLAPYSLWVAQYGAREPEENGIWPTWAGWQYSERGRVDGVEGNIDLDLFTAEMRAQPEPTQSAGPTSAPTPSSRADRHARADGDQRAHRLSNAHRRPVRGQRLRGAAGRHAHGHRADV